MRNAGRLLLVVAGLSIGMPVWGGGSRSPRVAAAPAATEIDGLDSLESATLTRAFDYLEIRPSELGFDKLYVDDDTFRLGIVEDLLNDPLKVPGWQKATVAEARATFSDLPSLAAFLGELCEAPEAGPRDVAIKDRGRGSRGPVESTQDPLGGFIARCRAAEKDLNQAFARLTDEDRRVILVLAPAFWGNWDEPGSRDIARKGMIHFEVGASTDTTLKCNEKRVLDAAARLDRGALTRASRLYLAALRDLLASIAAGAPAVLRPSEEMIHLDGVTGTVEAVHETPWGLLVIGGPGPNVYSAEALARIAFLIDPGGDDVYRGRAASAIGGGLIRPFSAIVDRSGNDLYDAAGRPYALGAGVLGVAALIDEKGDDIYRGDDGACGVGFFGAGFLYDGAGVDFFEGRNFSEGCAAFGLGALVSGCAPAPPPQGEIEEDRAFNLGLVKVPYTGGVPVRYDDNDIYQAARQSQGFASTYGAGLLYDKAGNDLYRAGGRYLHAPLRPNDFQSLSQGFSIGFRPRAGGGVGLLIDEEGNDFYDAEIYAQGVSYWYSIGLLYDRAGNDRYHATQYAQGAGVHLSVGSLWDEGGDDQYVSQLGVTQGTAHDLSAGWLLDEGGDDYYMVDGGQAMSITNSTAIFIDRQGNDVYATSGGGQGYMTWERGFCGAAIFLDLEGKDTYPWNSPGKDGAVWSEDVNAIGIDLDRDVVLPDENLPPVVLTAADSARAIADLFKDASMWEVGSARMKVRTARAALNTKGIPALDYVVREQLGSDDGLVYRAILELGQVYPDSFAARIVPRLFDPKEMVQRNVIGLIGDLKRKEARGTLIAMLGERKQEKHWTRVIQALGRIGDPAAAPAIRPYLRDRLERRRIVTCAALAALKDTTSIAPIAGLLDDPLLTVRAAASAALRSFGARGVETIARSIDTSARPRSVAVETLGRIAVALKDSTSVAMLQAKGRARATLMSALDRGIARSDPEVRAAAAAALLKLGEPEMKEYVRLRTLDETDPLVKRTCEKAMEGTK